MSVQSAPEVCQLSDPIRDFITNDAAPTRGIARHRRLPWLSEIAYSHCSMNDGPGTGLRSLAVLVGALAFHCLSASAYAQAPSECDQLWIRRNLIFKANGYCFSSGRGLQYFGNSGCTYTDQTAVPLTPQERSNVRLLAERESLLGCSAEQKLQPQPSSVSVPPRVEPPRPEPARTDIAPARPPEAALQPAPRKEPANCRFLSCE